MFCKVRSFWGIFLFPECIFVKYMSTESPSNHSNLEKLETLALVQGINQEDQSVASSVAKAEGQLVSLIDAVFKQLENGGRLFYLGAGTSGRLGVVDASECPPTFGVGFDKVIGIIAGGDGAMRRAVEFAEDDENQGFLDLEHYNVDVNDFVIGIAASGRTPYVVGALKRCNELDIPTGCIVCNENSVVASNSIYPIEIITGPEFITGSTRMKAGTATKLALNTITTSVMIKLGRVVGNKMVDMQLTNHKLIDRGARMIMDETGLDYETAKLILQKEGNVRLSIEKIRGW
jgi:N-acetylmuramic acid 6-phosphate etherase